VIRAVLAFSLLLILPATASAQSGGTLAGPTARSYSASPASVAPGARVTFALRATPGALVRVDVLAPGKAAVRVKLGTVGEKGSLRGTWRAAVAAAAAVTATTTSKVFPVQGAYSFGGPDARFGVGRPGHTHQGQDITAAEGTPVVTPAAGSVHWTAFQEGGAGYYVVIAGADGRHYVFMHLQEGSIAVTKGAPVTAGQRVGLVGSTGSSTGPHLHFEIWVNGWWASEASTPIDPLPELQAWAAQ
jgi:murein DD-endopeptidase MepM/ murein hydrolase activator NlpD